MAEVLSQTEIDALLAAVSAGNVETQETPHATATGGKDWIAYDLTSHEKVVGSRLVGLQGIHERFSRLFRATLSTALKKSVVVTCTNTDFIHFSDYLANILLPTSLNVIEMTNLKGFMILVMSSKLTYALVDAYYGGSERPFSKIGGREEFTTIESNMIQKISEMAIRDMQEAWKLNYPLELKYTRSESNPHFVGSIHGSETVAIVTFDVEFENLSGSFVVILQVRPLDPIQQNLSVNVLAEVTGEGDSWKEHWLTELNSLPLELSVELGTTRKALSELNAMKPGDVLPLSQDAASPLNGSLEGVVKLEGLMGICRGNRAIRLTNFVDSRKTN